MRCAEAKRLMQRAQAGDATAADDQRLDEHMTTCPGCAGQWATMTRLADAVRVAAPTALAIQGDIAAEVGERLGAGGSLARGQAARVKRLVLRVAAAAIVLGAVAWVVMRSTGGNGLLSVVEAAMELQPTHWVVRLSDTKGRVHFSEEIWRLPNGDKYRHFKGPLDRPEYTRMARHDSDYTWMHDPETNEFRLVAPSSTPEESLGIEGTGLVDLPQASRHGAGWALRLFLRDAQQPFQVKRSTRVFNGEPVAAFIIEGPRAEGDGSIRLTYYLTRDLSRLVRELAEFPAEGPVGFIWETWPIEYEVQPPAVLFGLDRVFEYMEEAERERIIGTVYALAEAWRTGNFEEFQKHYDFAAGLEYGVKGKWTAEARREHWKRDVERQPEPWADQELTVDYGFGTAEPPAMALHYWSIYREKPQSGDGWILYRQEPSTEPGIIVLARVKVTDKEGETRELGTQLFLKKIGAEYKVILWRPPFG